VPVPAPDLVAGRYAVREVLAVGGMSTVHLAEDTALGRPVALKVFRTSGDPLAAERLRREGALLARLEHPHLVRGFDGGADEDGSNAWLALELLTGPNLAVALHRNGPLAPAGVRRLIAHVADALAYIHGLGIVHRDVKPSNVLLTADPAADPVWRAKLADFGIATEVRAEAALTGDGSVGTAAYFSPEQTLGHPVTPASDVYSLGLVALEALTGERAFPGGAVESATARLFRQPTLPDWLDEGWRALLETMTARDPKARPSAEQVRAACRSLTSELLAAPAIARADDDFDVRTEPATLFAPAVLAALEPVTETPIPGTPIRETPVPGVRTRRRWRALRLRPATGFADRFSRRALVVSSAGVLVLGTAAGGAALVAAAPAQPIPLEQALPVAPPVEAVQARPTPAPQRSATPRPQLATAVVPRAAAPVVARHADHPTRPTASPKRGAAKPAGPAHARPAVEHATKHAGPSPRKHHGERAPVRHGAHHAKHAPQHAKHVVHHAKHAKHVVQHTKHVVHHGKHGHGGGHGKRH
jgi:hypothetical protein